MKLYRVSEPRIPYQRVAASEESPIRPIRGTDGPAPLYTMVVYAAAGSGPRIAVGTARAVRTRTPTNSGRMIRGTAVSPGSGSACPDFGFVTPHSSTPAAFWAGFVSGVATDPAQMPVGDDSRPDGRARLE